MNINPLEFEKVSYQYRRNQDWALSDISLKIQNNTLTILAGPTGSGKSTILKIARGLHKEYSGKIEGEIRIFGEDIDKYPIYELSRYISIIYQNPSYQLHQSRVIDEIISPPIYQNLPWEECIERANKSINDLLDAEVLQRNPSNLSIGEQQKVALASSMTMRAEILLLDEPFAYLDSYSQEEFFRVIKSMMSNGMTIILATHHLDTVVEIANRIIVLDKGKIILDGLPKDVLYNDKFNILMKPPIFIDIGRKMRKKTNTSELPISWSDIYKSLPPITPKFPKDDNISKKERKPEHYLDVVDISYFYSSNRGVNNIKFGIRKGEIFGLIGCNASGKSTIAKIIVGLLKPSNGYICISGNEKKSGAIDAQKIGYVSQNPSDMIFETSVIKECAFGPRMLNNFDLSRIEHVLKYLGLYNYLERDPRSLSGGEQRLLSIACILVNEPNILIFDEPEFGLDPKTFNKITELFCELRDQGYTILVITQNIEATLFLCNNVALFKEGELAYLGNPYELVKNKNHLEDAGLKYPPFFQLVDYLMLDGKIVTNEKMFSNEMVSKITDKKIYD